MFDALVCDARAMFYGVSAAIDGMKVKSICKKIEKERNVKLSVPKQKASDKEAKNTANENKTKEVEKKEEKKPQTVVPVTVISNPDAEKTVVLKTEKPIDIQNIKKDAEKIGSEIEKAVSKKVDEIIYADPEEKADIVTEITQTIVDEAALTKHENAFKSFMEKSKEEQDFAIYDAIVRKGDKVLKALDNINSENETILYDIFVTDILGLELSDVGKDSLDNLISQFEGFEQLFSSAVTRAVTYLRTKEPDAEEEVVNETVIGSTKLNLEEKVTESKETTNGLKRHITFVDNNQADNSGAVIVEESANKGNKRTSKRK